MKILINAIISALIVVPTPGLMPERVNDRANYYVSARNKRRLMAAGKWVWL